MHTSLSLNNFIFKIQSIIDKTDIFFIIKNEITYFSKVEARIKSLISTIDEKFLEIKKEAEQKFLIETDLKNKMDKYSLIKYKFSKKQIKLFQNYINQREAEQNKIKSYFTIISEPKNFVELYNDIFIENQQENVYFRLKEILNIQNRILECFNKIYTLNKNYLISIA